ncbi:MAG TPA: HlyD family efflux transporter periplasmic adaptor subunit [Gemmatimonadales bacterium]|jgi:HlyD family secretion protein|nr:HlyD family efflux transporter periplasmic adaptor subunit [Gemmatimonadales bacterium]
MRFSYRRSVTPLVVVLGTAALASCGKNDVEGYGNFEATEVTVGAEVGGPLLSLGLEEGDRVRKGVTLGTVDTVPLLLERQTLVAKRAAGASRAREASANIAALDVQLAIADRELARTERLLKQAAATAQQGDKAEREAKMAREQLAGARAARSTAEQEVAALDAQVAQLDDRLARSRIVSPQDGTVLVRYVEPGEYIQSGQPLFKLASLDSLTFRAYVSHAQLTRFKLGQSVKVGVDHADSIVTLPGRITWIASAAEFTPTPIQTRDERADQVYAVKVVVANPDGSLRIGMPGELILEGGAKDE